MVLLGGGRGRRPPDRSPGSPCDTDTDTDIGIFLIIIMNIEIENKIYIFIAIGMRGLRSVVSHKSNFGNQEIRQLEP